MMTREKMKSIFTVHTNGKDEWIKVPKRTYDKMIDMFCDAHEADLKKACEILEGANLAEIERHFAECKAKDVRIAELFSELSATYVKCFHKDIENQRLKGRIAGLEAIIHKQCDGCIHPLSDNGSYSLEPCCECRSKVVNAKTP